MKNRFDKMLKKVINQLPEYTANPDSWAAIEQYLGFSGKLHEVKNGLPVYKAPDGIWPKLENIRVSKTKAGFNPVWKVAAVILILTGSWFIFHTFSSRKLSYSTEVAADFNPGFSLPADSALEQVTEFIDRQCKKKYLRVQRTRFLH